MNLIFPPWAFYIYAALAVAAIVAWFATKDRAKDISAKALLVVLCVFVAHFLTVMLTSKKLGTDNPTVAVETSEMQLRLFGAYDSLRRHGEKDASSAISKLMGANGKNKEGAPKHDAKEEKQRKETLETEQKALEKSLSLSPKNLKYRAKLIILFGELGETDKVREQLKTMMLPGNVDDEPTARELQTVLSALYVNKNVDRATVKKDEDTLAKTLPPGWFRDEVTERLFRDAKEDVSLSAYEDEVYGRNVIWLGKMGLMLVIIFGGGLVGVVNVFIQLGLLSRSGAKREDEVGLPSSWQIIIGVFIGWFVIQIAIGALIGQVFHFKEAKQAVDVALATTVSYLVMNTPGLFLIHYLALKPHGLKFFDALHMHWRTSTAGPVKTIFGGYLGVCSAIPLVAAAAYFAHRFLNVNNSDNPVIAQFIQAASAANPAAILIFFFTIGVMAPFFEEIFFRGFLYSALKRKIGTPLAMIVSAAIFAGVHFDKGGSLMLFVIGFVLAFTYERTRSLYASMITHGLWNSTTCLLMITVFGA